MSITHILRKFQSTHPIRSATANGSAEVWRQHDFNPRTPYGVRLTVYLVGFTLDLEFQSTHPIRSATKAISDFAGLFDISIHAPHTECDRHTGRIAYPLLCISIHAPHTECDPRFDLGTKPQSLFQSTHPIRSATGGGEIPP